MQYRNVQDVDGNVSKAITSWDNTKKAVQLAAVSVLYHARKHGDYTKANVLVNGLKGVNQTGLVEFFKVYGGLISPEGEDKFTAWSGAEYIEKHWDEAKKTMWWDLKPQKPFEGFEFDKKLAAFLASCDKADELLKKLATEDPEKASKIKIDYDKLDQIKALA